MFIDVVLFRRTDKQTRQTDRLTDTDTDTDRVHMHIISNYYQVIYAYN